MTCLRPRSSRTIGPTLRSAAIFFVLPMPFAFVAPDNGLVAQEVGGVTLGETHIDSVRQVRGQPQAKGRTVGGAAYFLSYERFTYYFSGYDSLAVAVRIFPDSMFRSEARRIFGKPQETERRPDLSLYAVYADTLAILFHRSGQRVQYIEYQMSDRAAEEYSFRNLTAERQDSIEDAKRANAHNIVYERIRRMCDKSERPPSLKSWNNTFADIREYAGQLITRFRRLMLDDMSTACALARDTARLPRLHRKYP